MPRVLSTTFIALALIVSAAGAYAPAAHAQETTLPGTVSCTSNNDCPSNSCNLELGTCNSVSAPLLTPTQTSIPLLTNSPSSASAQTSAAGAGNPITLPPNPSKNADFGTIMTWIMTLFAWLLGVAMLTLDNVMYYTVVTMGNYVHQLSAVGTAWRVLRDVGNIVLIFGFLAIGISTILNTEKLGYGTKMLPMLLVAAVFLNFSLFISEAIIDTGNLFATEIYTQINGGNPVAAPDYTSTNVSNEAISNKIMSQLGLQSIYGSALHHPAQLTGSSSWLIGFMGIILFMVAAFVIFSLAFILIARFIMLIFLIIIAPIGFAGLAVPKLEGTAKLWWSTLFEQTITAPVLLLLLYIALRVITAQSFLTGFGVGSSSGSAETAWNGFINNTNLTGFGSVLLSFIVAMGLLFAVVIIAKKMSAVGSGAVMKAGNNLTSRATKFAMSPVKFAGRQTAGAARWTARQTAGRSANYLSQKVMTSKTFGDTQAGRILATGLGKRGAGFVELEKASQKKHDEYKKARDAAIDAQHLPTVAAAQLERATIERATESEIKKAQTEKTAAIDAAKIIADEVKRLEKIVEDNRNAGKFGPAQEAAKQALEVARAKSISAADRVKETDANLAKISKPLEDAIDKEKEATKALTAAKQKAAVAYAENLQAPITGSPVTWAKWAVSGTHSNAVANKIIKDATKKGENLKETMKKWLKEEERRENQQKEQKEGESESETGKPDATKPEGAH